MKTLVLVLIIFILNGCSQKAKDCTPVPCINVYPKLPTYKVPSSRPFKVVRIDDNRSIAMTKDLLDVVKNNTRLRQICANYAVINKRVNREYQK